LNDHLAGAVAALELLADLIETYKGQQLQDFFVDLRRDIEADVNVLRKLIGRTHARESVLRKAIAWIAGKFAI
jgi:methionine salvage enolase-phosphatase E1